MAKRKSPGKSRTKAVKREKGEPVEAPAVAAAVEAQDDERQPDLAPPATRGRKKKATGGTPKHWQVAEPGEVAPEPPAEHLAKCGACAAAVKFTRSASGAGIVVAERYGVDVDTTFGIGPSGKPVCPNGHGEMSLADEGMSAAEAFTQAKAKVDATATQRLPFPAPPFNHEGAMREVFAKRHDIAELEEIVKKRGEAFKDAKKELEDANTLLGKMIDEFERRAQDRSDEMARQAAAAERDADVTLCGRVTAFGFSCDVATIRAMSAESRATLEARLADAEEYPDDVARWQVPLHVALGAVVVEQEETAAVPDDFGTGPLNDEAAAAMAPGEVPDGDPGDEFDAVDDPGDEPTAEEDVISI